MKTGAGAASGQPSSVEVPQFPPPLPRPGHGERPWLSAGASDLILRPTPGKGMGADARKIPGIRPGKDRRRRKARRIYRSDLSSGLRGTT
jgi:hypothetical protein